MSKKGIPLIGILILGLAFLAQSVFDIIGFGADNIRLINTENGISFALDSNPSFHSNGNRNFHFVTRTGVRHVNDRGETRWQESFLLTQPQMAARGDIIAVGEANMGRVIYVYNSEGLMYTQHIDNPVRGFSVNSAGDLSVITQFDGGFEVLVYNQLRHNDHVFGMQVVQAVRPMQIPVIAEVSEDGRFVAIAYLDYSRHLSAAIEFWPIGHTPWGTDGLFAQTDFPDELFITMRFMADNHVLIITRSRIILYQIEGNVLQRIWTEYMSNEIDQLAFCGNDSFAFASGTALRPDGRYADPVGTVNIFNLSGPTGSYNLGRRVTYLSMDNNTVIAGAERYFHAVNSRGTSLWHHNVLHDVRDMIFLHDTDTVLIAGANRADVWRRQRVRNGGN